MHDGNACKSIGFRSYPDDSAELVNVGDVMVSEVREFIFNVAPTCCFV
jgi:hypothetical protein